MLNLDAQQTEGDGGKMRETETSSVSLILPLSDASPLPDDLPPFGQPIPSGGLAQGRLGCGNGYDDSHSPKQSISALKLINGNP